MNFNTKVHFDFMKHRKTFFIASAVLVVIGILSLLLFSMNFGVDFKAGTTMDISVGKSVSQQEAKEVLAGAGFEDVTPVIGGSDSSRVSVRFDEVLEQSETKKIEGAFSEKFGDHVSTEVYVVSPDMAKDLGKKAIVGIVIASLAIMLYVMIRFEWRFAVAANIAILYDAFVVIAVFSIFRLEVDLPFIAAVLTTIGYSINDKIVIFDRIRENLRFGKFKNGEQLAEMVNQSLWQTMARNIYTVLTVLIIAACLFAFGSESIKLFALAKMIGLVSGAYSSICIAAPLWLVFKSKQKPKAKQPAKTAV
ncbi:protein translocase subunit SecF [Paenibacillus sp. NPDC058071]|uniref:protein translocase subunit SecF n=1 Tax=Paenibacillus sp. NPDC058071 TaxID=3346326 RepID=UPI0036DA3B33